VSARILIVDDDDEVRETVRDVLLDAGYEVACAADGADALRQLAELATPDLLLVDLLMPGMSGQELLRALADDPRACASKVVIFSALPQRQLPSGYPHVPKPSAIGDLLRILDDVLKTPPRAP
jgi:CheY-like chemotaxis protein